MTLIRNNNQLKQGIDFTGVQNGNIHPTDIDAVLEFDNEALILIEAKRENNEIPTGQRLVLERICDSWHTEKSIALFVTHKTSDTEKLIDLHRCKVYKYYYNNKWHTNKGNTDFNNMLNKLGDYWGIKKLKI
tara:strand:+ start:32 stop:427 length:396 start_codon:yes stop_codon:yes gene_type:complete